MRYLMIVNPLLLIIAAGFIVELVDCKVVLSLLLCSAVVARLIDVMYFDGAYSMLLLTSLALTIASIIILLASSVLKVDARPLLTILLVCMLMVSVFINVNDAKIGCVFRQYVRGMSDYVSAKAPPDSIIVYPRGFPQDIAEYPKRVVVYYPPNKLWLDIYFPKDGEEEFYSELNRTLEVGATRPRYLVMPYENTTVGVDLMGRFSWDGVIYLKDYQPSLD